MAIAGIQFKRADNKRLVGWEQLHIRLKGLHYGTVQWEPMLYFCDSCEDTIRTLPTLQHDEVDVEDLDTDAEDHAADETRYAVMSRPFLPKGPGGKLTDPELRLPIAATALTFSQLVERSRQRRLQNEGTAE
jgi:hypothetical protein